MYELIGVLASVIVLLSFRSLTWDLKYENECHM